MGHIFQTGGYLLGFVFTILIIGAVTRRFSQWPPALSLSMVLGMAVCYAFGTVWFSAVYMGSLNSVTLGTALMKCVVPYVIPDCVKIGVAVIMVKRISPSLL